MSGIMLVVCFVGFILYGVPIAFSIALVALLGIMNIPAIPEITVPMKMANGLNSFVLLAVPLFILAANIMNSGKISEKMIEFSTSIVGSVRGGLAHANILVSMIFAGVSGSSAADTAGVGKILIPSMIDTGYDVETSVGVTAASSTIGVIIPPSIPMVVYAGLSNTSVGDLFLGGIIPGIMIGLGMMLLVYILSFSKNFPIYAPTSFKRFIKLFWITFPALLTPLIIIGGILSGVYTPTESAAFAAVYAFLISWFFYRTLTPKHLPKIIMDSMLQSAQPLFALSAATALGELLGYYRVSIYVEQFFASYVTSGLSFMVVIIVFFLLIGTFMDALPAMILFVPVLLPTALKFGIDPVALGVTIVITLAVGLVTPPYGICLLIAANIGNLSVGRSFHAVIPYISVVVVLLVILTFFPQIITFLPMLLRG